MEKTIHHSRKGWIKWNYFIRLWFNVCCCCLQGMEALQSTGKVKNIGVSNFSIRQLERLMALCRVPPAINQVLHFSVPIRNSLSHNQVISLNVVLKNSQMFSYCQRKILLLVKTWFTIVIISLLSFICSERNVGV